MPNQYPFIIFYNLLFVQIKINSSYRCKVITRYFELLFLIHLLKELSSHKMMLFDITSSNLLS